MKNLILFIALGLAAGLTSLGCTINLSSPVEKHYRLADSELDDDEDIDDEDEDIDDDDDDDGADQIKKRLEKLEKRIDALEKR